MGYRKHLTVYGGALAGADPALLEKYDTIIVSPSTYAQLPEILKPRAAAYFSFFCWPRYRAAANDWQPGPGDMKMPEVFKTKGGTNWIYTVSQDWTAAFCSAMLRFALRHPFQRIFLEDWQRSHSWWELPNWAELAFPPELPMLMRRVEQVANWISMTYGSGAGANAVALTGYPGDFALDETVAYHESVGSSWNGPAAVAAKAKEGDFFQVNGANEDSRAVAALLALYAGGSLGCQPTEGVLNYDSIENPDDWPLA